MPRFHCQSPRAAATLSLLFWLVVSPLADHSSRAFVPPTVNLALQQPQLQLHQPSFSSSTRLGAAIPVLDRWKVLSNGSIVGTVRGHATIDDGDVITTSPIADPNAAKSQGIVETASGSKYRLLSPLKERQSYSANGANASTSSSSSSGGGGGGGGAGSPSFNFGFLNDEQQPETVNGNGPYAPSATNTGSSSSSSNDKVRSGPEWRQAVAAYKLTQACIGPSEEYLLAGKPVKSTSGKSNIWEAYQADEATGGLPKAGEPPVCIKVSTNLEAVSREYENYRKLSFLGIARGRFVRCHEFFPVASYDKRFKNQCALVLEKGAQDLKSFMNEKGRLEGKELRDACISAAQCVQALHNVGLVWTDLKTENFVVMSHGEVKGIDLESAMPVGDNPVDYSPEACPPEFAEAFLAGDGPYFTLETSYDIWSLGMLMLELSTGQGFFDGKTPAQITKWLRDAEETIPVDDFDIDDRLKDLLRRCLQPDPKKRPNMAQILLHPYFITSPFSIFQNFS